MNPESIDRIEHSTYTPLEKKYLKVQFVKVRGEKRNVSICG